MSNRDIYEFIKEGQATVSKLVSSAAGAESADSAMKFSQAALNAANAICATCSALKVD